MKSHEKSQIWLKRFEEQKASGLSIARFCKKSHLNYNTWNYWSRKLRSTTVLPVAHKGPAFIPLPIFSAAKGGSILLRIGSSIEAQLPVSIDPKWVAELAIELRKCHA